jgi:drug/metabolite transporter (DMT)-like permease
MISKNQTPVYFALLMTILLWGVNWPMNKIGLEYIPAIWHAALRNGIGSLCMFALVLALGKFKMPSKRDLPLITIVGLLQMGIFALLINLGLTYVDAGRSAILVYTIPLWVTPLAIILFKETLNGLKILGLSLGMFGLMILFSPWSMDFSTQGVLFGNGILICAALCMAGAILFARHFKSTSSALELLPWQLLIGSIPIFLVAFFMDPHPTIDWNATSISVMGYTAILATAFGNWGLSMVSRNLPSITTSIGLLGVPLTGVISAAIILHEDITVSMRVAMVLIFSGLICVTLSGKMNKSSLVEKTG